MLAAVLDSSWTPQAGMVRVSWLEVYEGFWSGCRDLNPGPLAPPSKKYQSFAGGHTENKTLVTPFGPKPTAGEFGLHNDCALQLFDIVPMRSSRNGFRSPLMCGWKVDIHCFH